MGLKKVLCDTQKIEDLFLVLEKSHNDMLKIAKRVEENSFPPSTVMDLPLGSGADHRNSGCLKSIDRSKSVALGRHKNTSCNRS